MEIVVKNKEQEFTSISNLGEFGLIDQIPEDKEEWRQLAIQADPLPERI